MDLLETAERDDSQLTRLVQSVNNMVVHVNNDDDLVKNVNLSRDGLVVGRKVFLHIVIERIFNLQGTKIRYLIDHIRVRDKFRHVPPPF